jgi:lycopene cyclase domain-containing protein
VSYTTLAVLAVLATLLLDLVVLRTRLVTRRAFWVAYAIVLGFQLLVNGVLTGRGVVVYDPDAVLGARVASAPLEDVVFGFTLVTQTLAWWVWWGRRQARATAIGRGGHGPVPAGPRPADAAGRHGPGG